MMSPTCERAYEDLIRVGKGLLKFITPNEVDSSQSHQSGYYIPKPSAPLFTPQKVQKGLNHNHPVEVTWPDDTVTKSTVKWYGDKSRSEYRLTGFGRNFPWANHKELVGDLLILVPQDTNRINGYVLDLDDDIEEIFDALGVSINRSEPGGSFAVFDLHETAASVETEDACLRRQYATIVQQIESMPSGRFFSDATLRSVSECIREFASKDLDERLLLLLHEEFKLFKLAERKIYSPQITQLRASIDDFVNLALSILNARKSRAGRAFENHVEHVLKSAGVSFQMRAPVLGKPDVLIPGAKEYEDPSYPVEKLFVLGLKTTCKDRWRQVLAEAPRVPAKHLVTLQEGVSMPQLEEMKAASVQLVVPEGIHRAYPKDGRKQLWSVTQLVSTIKQTLANG